MTAGKGPYTPSAPGTARHSQDDFGGRLGRLSPEHKSIALLDVAGKTAKEIGIMLRYHRKIIERIIKKIPKDLGLSTRAQFIVVALSNMIRPVDKAMADRIELLKAKLTQGQLKVIQLALDGLNNEAVADRLAIAVSHVSHYVMGAMRALDIQSRAELLQFSVMAKRIRLEDVSCPQVEADLTFECRQDILTGLSADEKTLLELLGDEASNYAAIAKTMGRTTGDMEHNVLFPLYGRLPIAGINTTMKRQHVTFCFRMSAGELLKNPFEQLAPALSKVLPGLLGWDTVQEIAEKSGLSETEVRGQAKIIYQKAGVPGRESLHTLAARLGVLGKYLALSPEARNDPSPPSLLTTAAP